MADAHPEPVHRFPRSARLRSPHEFQKVRDSGLVLKGRWITIGFRRRDAGERTANGLRVGIVTSRRVGKAHERNLARRRIREILRAVRCKIASDVDLVVIMKKKTAPISFAAMRSELLHLLIKSKLLPPAPDQP